MVLENKECFILNQMKSYVEKQISVGTGEKRRKIDSYFKIST
jgi:hypothetical protein